MNAVNITNFSSEMFTNVESLTTYIYKWKLFCIWAQNNNNNNVHQRHGGALPTSASTTKYVFKNSKNELELLLLISILGSQKRFGNWRNQSWSLLQFLLQRTTPSSSPCSGRKAAPIYLSLETPHSLTYSLYLSFFLSCVAYIEILQPYPPMGHWTRHSVGGVPSI